MSPVGASARGRLCALGTIAATCLLVAACCCHRTTPCNELTPSTETPQLAVVNETVLTAGDILEVKFTYAPQFNEALTVRPDGKIQVQLAGEVTAKGKTPLQLQQDLMSLCSSQLQHPELAVITRKLHQAKVYVGGEVKAPGKIDMPGPMTALEAIMQAGGFDMRKANVANVIVIRHREGQRYGCALDYRCVLKGLDDDKFYLEPFDIVWVPRTPIAVVNQWIDQYINKIIPQTGFMYQTVVGHRSTIGIQTEQPDTTD